MAVQRLDEQEGLGGLTVAVGTERWREEPKIAVDAIGAIDNPPPVDQLVVCHGDACAPNTLLSADGGLAGHVDFGALGVADHWADLAVATWSIVWNYGPAWEHRLLDAYGIDPDPERTAYCRLLWDLGP
ncbi:MAG: phosphotransferase [Actinomycetia bacterium]|nr:phosphotransferase [Actinomycetes bacterium]